MLLSQPGMERHIHQVSACCSECLVCLADLVWVGLQASQPGYDEIKMGLSLSSQLARKTIIEYPEFIVLLPNEASAYQLQGAAQATEAGNIPLADTRPTASTAVA